MTDLGAGRVSDYRVLVTGSRYFPDSDTVLSALDDTLAAHPSMTVVHGDAYGVDHLAHHWADGRPGVREERHPALWRPGGVFNRAAGFQRNAEMVALGADICLAFIGPCRKENCRQPQPHGSHGATHCADLAEKAGIQVRRFAPAI